MMSSTMFRFVVRMCSILKQRSKNITFMFGISQNKNKITIFLKMMWHDYRSSKELSKYCNVVNVHLQVYYSIRASFDSHQRFRDPGKSNIAHFMLGSFMKIIKNNSAGDKTQMLAFLLSFLNNSAIHFSLELIACEFTAFKARTRLIIWFIETTLSPSLTHTLPPSDLQQQLC